MNIIYFFLIFMIMGLQEDKKEEHIKIIMCSMDKYQNIVSDTEGYYMKYNLKITYRSSAKITDDKFDVLYNNQKLRLTSTEYTYYKDTSISYFIYKKQKSIYFTNSSRQKNAGEKINFLMNISRKFISSAELLDFKIIENGQAVINLKLQDDLPVPYRNAQIKYIINTDNCLINTIHIIYNSSDYEIKDMEMKFIEQHAVKSDEFFNQSIESNIFNENGELKPEYVGYKIIKQ